METWNGDQKEKPNTEAEKKLGRGIKWSERNTVQNIRKHTVFKSESSTVSTHSNVLWKTGVNTKTRRLRYVLRKSLTAINMSKV